MKNKNKRQEVLALLNQKQGVAYKFLAAQIDALSEETLDQLLLAFNSDDSEVLLGVVEGQEEEMQLAVAKLTELSEKFDEMCRKLERNQESALIAKNIKK